MVRGWPSSYASIVGISNTSQDPDSLLKFFVPLATSPEADLGHDVNIERVDETDLDLKFTIEGRVYRTSTQLYDIGAHTPTGRETWVFKVKDQAIKKAYASRITESRVVPANEWNVRS